MPVNHEDGRRWVEMSLVVPGTPEQVWQAIATGAGNTSWFTNTEIDEKVGGTIRFDFGPNGSSQGEVTDWDPPQRLGYVEKEWCGDAPPVATEITVTGRSGDRCVIRMVHSLFTDADDWDDEIEGFETGWPGHFAVLQTYLAHFVGQPAVTFHVAATADLPQPEVWRRLLAAFDLGDGQVGAIGAGPATVERVSQDPAQRHLVARMAAGTVMLGTCAPGGQTSAGINAFFYGADAARRAADAQPKWQRLLDDALA